jgi:hypothetical protein
VSQNVCRIENPSRSCFLRSLCDFFCVALVVVALAAPTAKVVAVVTVANFPCNFSII